MKHGPLSASNKLATIKQFIGTIDSIVLSTIGIRMLVVEVVLVNQVNIGVTNRSGRIIKFCYFNPRNTTNLLLMTVLTKLIPLHVYIYKK